MNVAHMVERSLRMPELHFRFFPFVFILSGWAPPARDSSGSEPPRLASGARASVRLCRLVVSALLHSSRGHGCSGAHGSLRPPLPPAARALLLLLLLPLPAPAAGHRLLVPAAPAPPPRRLPARGGGHGGRGGAQGRDARLQAPLLRRARHRRRALPRLRHRRRQDTPRDRVPVTSPPCSLLLALLHRYISPRPHSLLIARFFVVSCFARGWLLLDCDDVKASAKQHIFLQG